MQKKRANSFRINSKLSRREVEVLALVAKGLTNQAVADELVLAKCTVDCHLRTIYFKLEVTTRLRAVTKAVRLGLLPAEASI